MRNLFLFLVISISSQYALADGAKAYGDYLIANHRLYSKCDKDPETPRRALKTYYPTVTKQELDSMKKLPPAKLTPEMKAFLKASEEKFEENNAAAKAIETLNMPVYCKCFVDGIRNPWYGQKFVANLNKSDMNAQMEKELRKTCIEKSKKQTP